MEGTTMAQYDPRAASEEDLWKIILSGANQPTSVIYEQARMELNRRDRKATADHARKIANIAIASAIASVFSALAAVISAAIAYYH
jgi:hypothetical protein